ncbi:hypothetical protein [Mongoliimonas terrestris]|uniref:hypothetical protein n=1 Tax=Mongoliimonas terrestris TaxID=1709001 RepID=UPI0009496E7E|nr:hypothetical protein [Mongoliimonas terrestris]
MIVAPRVAALAAAGIFVFSTAAGIASIGGTSFLPPAAQPIPAAVLPDGVADVAFASAGLCAVMMVIGEARPGVTDIVDVTLGAAETAEVTAGHSIACGTGAGSVRPLGARLTEAALAKADFAAL